jgi:pilus assembly protein TadC
MEFLPMLLIPAVVLLAPVLLTALVLRYRRTRAEMRYQFLLKLAESGVSVPPVLPGEASEAPSDLRRALVLLSGGIGLSSTLLVLPLQFHVGRPLSELWGLGILPIALGLGYLTHWVLSRRGGGHG